MLSWITPILNVNIKKPSGCGDGGGAIPTSNFLLSISTPITREAPADFAPSATYEVKYVLMFVI